VTHQYSFGLDPAEDDVEHDPDLRILEQAWDDEHLGPPTDVWRQRLLRTDHQHPGALGRQVVGHGHTLAVRTENSAGRGCRRPSGQERP